MDPSGSNVAPQEGGNTKSPSCGTKKRDAGKVGWFLTLKWPHGINYTYFKGLQSWIKAHSKRAVLVMEIGKETGYQHLHIQLSLKTKQRFEWFKHHLSPIVNCQVTKCEEAAFDYCAKDPVWGPWYWPERPTIGVQDPLKDLELHSWEKEIIEIIEGEVHPRKIYWYWEPVGNVGKTMFCKHLIIKYDAEFFQGGAKKDIAYSYRGGKICVFDFSRDTEGHISYDAIEALKGGLVFSAKYESGVKIYEQPHVLCFANWEPNIDSMSDDRWVIRKI